MKRALAGQRGFTLIEVLVALALMALLSVISWRALDLVERSSERLGASTDDTLALVRVLGQIQSDVSRYAGSDVLASPATEAASEAESSTASGTGSAISTGPLLPPGIVWADPALIVVRSAGDGAWQRVVWRKEGDTLRRAVAPASQALPLPEPGAGETVLTHVKGFAVRAWVPGRGWSAIKAMDMQLTATGLEIQIERQHNGVDETYRKVVVLP